MVRLPFASCEESSWRQCFTAAPWSFTREITTSSIKKAAAIGHIRLSSKPFKLERKAYLDNLESQRTLRYQHLMNHALNWRLELPRAKTKLRQQLVRVNISMDPHHKCISNEVKNQITSVNIYTYETHRSTLTENI